MPFQKGNKLQKLKKNFPDFKGDKNPFWGKHHSEKSKEQFRKKMIGKLAGDKHPGWKGGITPKYWAEQVKIRDGYKCQICGLFDPRINQADHIKSKVIFPELKFNINNGMTLCPNCHSIKTYEDKLLKEYKSNLTKKQWIRQKNNQHLR